MRRVLRKSCWLLVVLGQTLSCGAFSLLGPWKEAPGYPDGWQGLNYLAWPLGLGYNLPGRIVLAGGMYAGDIGGPMGLDEEYRWNTKHVYYAYDQSFLNYFGNQGVLAISNAFHVLNSVTNASQIDTNFLTRRYAQSGMLRLNYRAQTLGLLDLKSAALEMMVEQLGLADPVRFMWNVRALWPPQPLAPQYFVVINLNNDPLTWAPSWFVNGSMWGYLINVNYAAGYVEANERLLTTLPGSSASPWPVATSPILAPYRQQSMIGRQGAGQFWMNLTRDDVGGLRYMLRTNNYNVENYLPGTQFAVTNNFQVLFTNQDLRLLFERTRATTNDAATILSYYPGLNLRGSNSYYRFDPRGSLLAYFNGAPFPWRYQGLTVVRTTNFVPFNNYAWDNVVTNASLWPSNQYFYIVPTNLLAYQQNTIVNLLTNVIQLTNRVFDVDPTNLVDPNFLSKLYFVDTNNQVPVVTSNLALFAEQALTNSAAGLQGIYSNLVISSTYTVLTNQAITNYLYYYTNPPFAPVGTVTVAPYPVVTNVLVTNYYHTFANVVTNNYTWWSPVSEQRYEVYRPYSAPAGSTLVVTNLRSTSYYSNVLSGDFYIVPTNMVGYVFITSLLTNTVTITNSLAPEFLGTNLVGTNVVGTNVVAATNSVIYTNYYLARPSTVYTFSAYPVFASVSYYTQVVSAAYPVGFSNFPAATTNLGFLKPGVDKIEFHQTWYDSLLGQPYLLQTTNYWDTYVVASRATNVFIRRLLPQPDILFVSEDLTWQPWTNGLIPILTARSGTVSWFNNDAINGSSIQGGPGVIAPPIRIAFTDQLPYILNWSPSFLDETTGRPGVVWGSYDGTTNAPTVYPDIVSITDIEWLVLHPPPPPYPPPPP